MKRCKITMKETIENIKKMASNIKNKLFKEKNIYSNKIKNNNE